DRALDLHAVAHDARILHQLLDLLRRVARDLLGLEAVEGAAEILALAQDGDPGPSGLEAVEDELLIERAVIVFGHAPFLVVIGDAERVLLEPGAAWSPPGWRGEGFGPRCSRRWSMQFAPGLFRRAPIPPLRRRAALPLPAPPRRGRDEAAPGRALARSSRASRQSSRPR